MVFQQSLSNIAMLTVVLAFIDQLVDVDMVSSTLCHWIQCSKAAIDKLSCAADRDSASQSQRFRYCETKAVPLATPKRLQVSLKHLSVPPRPFF